MTLLAASPLTSSQCDAFAQEGVLLARGLLDPGALMGIKRELTEAIDRRARELFASRAIANLHQDAPFAQRYGLLMAQSPAIQDGFDVVPLFGRELFAFFHHPLLLDALSQLIGPELSLNPIHHIRAKPPQAQTAENVKGYFSVPWHQDSGVTVAEADASQIITVWLPLEDASEEMGCLQVLPGAHRLGHLTHVAIPGYGTSIRAADMPGITPRRMPMVSGDVLFMHRHCPHHSTPNRSKHCRWSLDCRFHATGDNSGRPWQPELRVRSQVDPGSVRIDHAAWVCAWQECLARGDGRTVHRVAAS